MDFDAEYALRCRNKNNRRAMVKLFIDGENVSGDGFLINANDHVDIKRSIDKDAAFKFVSLDSPDAIDFGKNGPNHDKVKGTIEARFYLEKEKATFTYTPTVEHHHHHHYPRPRPQPYWPPLSNPYPYGTWTSCSTKGSSAGSGQSLRSCSMSRNKSIGPGCRSVNEHELAGPELR
jgi:hypothetical protein